MTNSIIKVGGIAAEDIFNWMYQHVRESCGDGTAALVCENYQEIANYFADLPFIMKCGFKLNDCFQVWHEQEGFIFTDKMPNLFPGEYIFIVEKECYFNYDKISDRRSIKPCNLASES